MELNYSFDSPVAEPIDEKVPHIEPPEQTSDGDEYVCGNSGPAFEGHTPGRDQDRSRADEYIPAQGCSRYVS